MKLILVLVKTVFLNFQWGCQSVLQELLPKELWLCTVCNCYGIVNLVDCFLYKLDRLFSLY